jgi:hypothetical protein
MAATYIGAFGLRFPKPRCIAEIGRPGRFHGCNRVAHFWARSRHGSVLSYCKRHVSHATNPKCVSQPLKEGPVAYEWVSAA